MSAPTPQEADEADPPTDGQVSAAAVRTWALTAAVAAVAVLVYLTVPSERGPLSDVLHLPWWALVLAYYAAEKAIVAVSVQRGSSSQFSFSLTELPLVLGLLFADPGAVLLARLVAGLLVMLGTGYRELSKLAFNSAMFALEVAVALSLYRLLLGTVDPLEPLGWLALVGAVAVAFTLAAAIVMVVISINDGIWELARLRQAITLSAIAGAINTSLGLVAVLLLAADLRSAGLLALVTILLATAYQGYTSLSDKHESLVLLHRFTQRSARISDNDETMERLLRESMSLLRASYAQVVTFDDVRRDRLVLHAARVDQPVLEVDDLGLSEVPILGDAMRTLAPILIARGTTEERQQTLLRRFDIADAIVVPLEGKDGLAGTLCIGGRLGMLSPFTDDDVRLCETVANHASVLLENGRLVDQLREEVADKEHQASHDALTGLPNRTMFHDRVQRAVLRARAAGGIVAVVILDLDRFKEINDTLGHHVGDDLLQEVGKRLRASVKSGDTVARLGGDEFAIVLPQVHDAAEALQIAERARHALEEPFEIGTLTLVVGASFGIALAPEHGNLATVLLQRADVAMYAAKASHAGTVVYAADVDTHSPRRLALVGDLRKAIEGEELLVHFQPKADARTGAITGAEALVRWTHPSEGPISPDEFIPIAERTGMIHALTEQVLTKALAQCAAWRRSGRRIDVAVNVSAGSLMNLEFPQEVRRLLAAASVAPSTLTLEITESSIMADPQRSLHVLRALSAMGVQLAIDDFGTGYSSLSQLKQMPVNELKIDRSFILDMISDDDDATIVRSTIDLGHNLGLRVVAEGVEDRETWRRLRALGCDVAQGYYLSRPLEPLAFERWAMEWEDGIEQRVLPPADERARGVGDDSSFERARYAGLDVEALGFDGLG
jgi:diguanylate cyclase (GGDEF)-like protein